MESQKQDHEEDILQLQEKVAWLESENERLEKLVISNHEAIKRISIELNGKIIRLTDYLGVK